MFEVDIPGYKKLNINYLVCDYNGTLAVDGQLIDGVDKFIYQLSDIVEIHVVTADTFGLAEENLSGLPIKLSILSSSKQDKQKAEYVYKLGNTQTVTLGNGRNDYLMLKESALGICIMEKEGIFSQNLLVCDVVCTSVYEALNLFLHPKRLVATLRA